jgi:hypothetical protein
MAKTKIAPKNKKKQKDEVIEPEVVGSVDEVEEFNTAQSLPSNGLYTVKLDAKKIDNRTADQVASIVLGSLGAVKKITIETDSE